MRRFFSSLVQRAAKAHRRLKGGSTTMLLLLPGVPASGEPPPAAGAARNAAEGYKHLSEEQRAKLKAALERQVRRTPLLGVLHAPVRSTASLGRAQHLMALTDVMQQSSSSDEEQSGFDRSAAAEAVRTEVRNTPTVGRSCSTWQTRLSTICI